MPQKLSSETSAVYNDFFIICIVLYYIGCGLYLDSVFKNLLIVCIFNADSSICKLYTRNRQIVYVYIYLLNVQKLTDIFETMSKSNSK